MQKLLKALSKPFSLPVVAAGLLLPFLLGNGSAQTAVASTSTLDSKAIPDAKETKETKRHWYQIGRASWYGGKFQGRATASGESFDMNDFTAAHRTLPLGSWVKVTNLRNKKSVVVRINDRGPVPADRCLDLSRAAAHALGMNGVASVRLELLKNVSGAMVAGLQTPAIPVAAR
jgi:rare lipoprotein A